MRTPKLSPDEITARLAALSAGWTVEGGTAIKKRYDFSDFKAAMAFVNRLADAAEAADHHPDLDIRYTRVVCMLSTHSAGGITQLDLDLATEIERLADA